MTPQERLLLRRMREKRQTASSQSPKSWLESEDRNVLFQLMEILNTPQNAIWGGVQAGLEGRDPLSGAVQGTYDNTSFSDVLGSAGWNPEKDSWGATAKAGVGLAGDIVLDPLNLVPLGWAKSAVKGVGKGVSAAVEAVPALDKAIEPVVSGLGKAGSKVAGHWSRLFGSSGHLAGEGFNEVTQATREAMAKARIDSQRHLNIMGRLQQEGMTPALMEELDEMVRIGMIPPGTLMEIGDNLPSVQQMAKTFFPDRQPQEAHDLVKRIILQRMEIAPKLGSQTEDLAMRNLAETHVMQKTTRVKKPKPDQPEKMTDALPDVEELATASTKGYAGDLPLEVGGVPMRTKKSIREDLKTMDTFGLSLKEINIIDDPVWDKWSQVLGGIREGMQSSAVRAGIPKLQLDDEINYALHFSTPDLQKAVLNSPLGSERGRQWSAAHASMLARKWRGRTVEEINAMGRMGELPGLEGIVVKKALYDDPFALEWVRGKRDIKARITGQLLQDLYQKGFQRFTKIVRKADPKALKKLDLKDDGLVEQMPEGWRVIDIMPGAPDEVKQASELWQFFNRVAWSPEVAPTMERYVEFATSGMRGDDSLKEAFLDFWDASTSVYKQLTLGWRPGYHARNVVGNAMLSFLAVPMRELPELIGNVKLAAGIQAALDPKFKYISGGAGVALGAGAGALSGDTAEEGLLGAVVGGALGGGLGAVAALKASKALTIAGKEYSPEQIWKMAERFGVVNTGQYGQEILQDLGRANRFQFHEKLSEFKAVKLGRYVGMALEDNARLGLFIHELRKGTVPTEAVTKVKKFLFDYADLTEFEQKTMKRIVPFYTWMKKNGVLQVTELINQPYKYAALGDVISMVEEDVPKPFMEDKIIAPFLRDRMGIRWRENAQGNPEYFLLGGWIPQADLVELAKPFTEREVIKGKLDPLLQGLTPFIQKQIGRAHV